MNELIVGSRGSALALHQTQMVIDDLIKLNPGLSCRVQIIKTTGDRIQDVPLAGIGDKGLFVKEIEQALLNGEIDFAVHSAKDLPSEMSEDLCIGAYPEREDPSDALVSKAGGLMELPAGARVGTSSVRRRAQLLAARHDLQVIDLRGNLDTRLKKVDSPEYDAVVLACAGLKRMGWSSRITEVLPFNICLPAVGQGALGVQCRKGDERVCAILGKLDHAVTRACVIAERALLSDLQGGCQVPIAAHAQIHGNDLILDVVVCNPDGSEIERASAAGKADAPAELGNRLACEILTSPAAKLLAEIRRHSAQGNIGAA